MFPFLPITADIVHLCNTFQRLNNTKARQNSFGQFIPDVYHLYAMEQRATGYKTLLVIIFSSRTKTFSNVPRLSSFLTIVTSLTRTSSLFGSRVLIINNSWSWRFTNGCVDGWYTRKVRSKIKLLYKNKMKTQRATVHYRFFERSNFCIAERRIN